MAMGVQGRRWMLIIWVLWLSSAAGVTTLDDKHLVTSGGGDGVGVCSDVGGDEGWYGMRSQVVRQ